MAITDYRRAWCDLYAAPPWLREWADDVLDAEEERETLNMLREFSMPRWYIDKQDFIWVRP